MRVPRSGGMIFGMFLALVGPCLMPCVFLLALAQSSESHPKPLRQTVAELSRPLANGLQRYADQARWLINR